MRSHSYVYIMSNRYNTTLYIGVTTNIVKRVWEHKKGIAKGFTKKYNLNKLVYFEVSESIETAIEREKQLKGGSRTKKEGLINQFNPEWKDLYGEIIK